jgi:hypothetical protein
MNHTPPHRHHAANPITQVGSAAIAVAYWFGYAFVN